MKNGHLSWHSELAVAVPLDPGRHEQNPDRSHDRGFPFLRAAEQWRGLVVAPEERCAPYDAGEYRYPQSVEPQLPLALEAPVHETFREIHETDTEHSGAVWRSIYEGYLSL